jgi:hypothetical protein
MSRFYAVSLVVSLAVLAGCADPTAPLGMEGKAQAQASSTAPASDGAPVTTTSSEDDPILRDGGNMMGGGGR